MFLNYMIHAGQPHPFDLLVVRLDLGLTDEEIVVHVREVLERQVGQALAQVRRGQASSAPSWSYDGPKASAGGGSP